MTTGADWTIPVEVLRGFRILFDGTVYGAGELVVLPALQACEWSCWGSVKPAWDRWKREQTIS